MSGSAINVAAKPRGSLTLAASFFPYMNHREPDNPRFHRAFPATIRQVALPALAPLILAAELTRPVVRPACSPTPITAPAWIFPHLVLLPEARGCALMRIRIAWLRSEERRVGKGWRSGGWAEA